MENPQINITNGYGESKSYTISFYAGDTDLTEEIVNYNFNRIEFHGDKDGLLSSIISYRPDLSQKIGDYPLISVNVAKELLAEGHFYARGVSATRNEEGRIVYIFPGLEYVKHVELVYLPENNHNVYIPYYAFYAGGLYYVPAIVPQYITNMPVDGFFPEPE